MIPHVYLIDIQFVQLHVIHIENFVGSVVCSLLSFEHPCSLLDPRCHLHMMCKCCDISLSKRHFGSIFYHVLAQILFSYFVVGDDVSTDPSMYHRMWSCGNVSTLSFR